MSVVANVAINVDSRGAVGKLREVQTQAQVTQRAFDGLGAAVGKLATAAAAIQGVRFIFAKTAELESQTRSLQVLTGSVQKAKQIIEELQQLGAVTPFTSTELIDSAKRLQAFGVEADKVVETTRRLADVSGATGAELQGLVTAYGQVQAKGRLQGEELLQFQERGIALQAELRKMYGLSGEEFQKALSKGQVSAQAVEVAIQRLTSAGGKYANGAIAQSDTLNGKFSTLQDGIDALARRIGQVLTPALKAIFNQAISVLDKINAALAAGRGGSFSRNIAAAAGKITIGAPSQAIADVSQGIGQITPQKNAAGIRQNLQALADYQNVLRRIRANDVQDPKTQEKLLATQEAIQTKITQNLAAQKQLATSTKATFDSTFKTPPLLAATGGGTKTKGKTDAEKLKEEAAKQLKAAQDLNFEQNKTLALLSAQNEYEKAFVQFGTQRAEIERKYNELFANSKSATETKVLQEAKSKELKAADLTLQQQITDLLKQAQAPLNDAVESIKNQAAYEREYGELIKNGTNPELATQLLQIKKAYDESVKLLKPALAAAQAAVTKAEAEGASAEQIKKYREELERIEAIRKGLEGKKGEGEQAAKDAAAAKEAADKAAKQPGAIVKKRIDDLKKEIANLTNVGQMAITIADGIGTAFGQAFQGLISGSMSAQEALASFFKSVGDMFISMATQIIAKQMVMIVLQTILKALGVVAGASGGGGGAPGGIPSTGDAALPSINGFDTGMNANLAGNGAFFSNGIASFKQGGVFTNSVISSPTLFKFADGGAMHTGLMGEAGPEAIMPLRRDGSGRLGVNASGLREAMAGGNSGGGGTVLNMSFETTSIGGVEYVSRDQLEAAMAQTRRDATRDGAKRGMTMTIDRLQQSPQTRSRVGLR